LLTRQQDSVTYVGFPHQCGQGEPPKPTESSSNGPLIVRLAGFEATEPLHQIEGRAVDLDWVDRRPALLPRPPRSGVVYAPLLEGGSLLNHSPSRSAFV